MVVAMSHGNDPQFVHVPFLVTFVLGQEKIVGRRYESRRRPLSFSCPLSCHLSSRNKKKIWVVAMSHGGDP